MTWARFDDGFWRNPKIVALPASAFRLYVRAVVYCCDQATDGRLGATDLDLIQAKNKDIAWLHRAGLWFDAEDNGTAHDAYEIKDFLKYNPSAQEIKSKRDSKAMAGAKGAAKRWGNAPDPSPTRPVVATQQQQQPRAREVGDENKRAYRAWEQQSPGSLLPPVVRHLDDTLEAGTPVEWIEKACESAAENGGFKPWNYIASTLRRYKSEGIESSKKVTSGTSERSDEVGLPDFDFEAADRQRDEWEARRLAAQTEGAVDRVSATVDTGKSAD